MSSGIPQGVTILSKLIARFDQALIAVEMLRCSNSRVMATHIMRQDHLARLLAEPNPPGTASRRPGYDSGK